MKRTLLAVTLAFSTLCMFAQTTNLTKSLAELRNSDSITEQNKKNDNSEKKQTNAERMLEEMGQVENDNSNPVSFAMSTNDYMVTAGDIYSLTYIANTTPITYTIPVDTTYKIKVSNLAVLDVNGQSFISLKKQVEEIVSKNYPMSGAQFVLINPASFKVTIQGEVRGTTEKTANALTRVSSILKGVTTDYTSLRDIKITSGSGKESVYDLYKALRLGDLSQDPYVRPGDVITLNRFGRLITIKGEVERPGTYELMESENLSELINSYAHGLAPAADTSRIELLRLMSDSVESGEKIYLSEESITKNFTLEPYDTITIPSYKALKPVMFIEGAVDASDGDTTLESSNRITMQFDTNTNYAYFIRENSELFNSAVADKSNAYIIRNGNILPFDINKALYDVSYYSEIIVENNDVLVVPFKQYFVSVAGAVSNPGRYPYIPDRTYEYYIGLAGGFNPDRNIGDAVTIRDINGKKVDRKSIITPETTITAKSNSAIYKFNLYVAPILTALVSIITTYEFISSRIPK